MNEASWEDCLESNATIKISKDIARVKSLIETSEERIEVIKNIDRKNCNFVFEDYYTSIMELLQAFLAIRGYKILNHVCLGFYIRDVLCREDLYILFDDVRYKRNSLTYYGRRMDFDTARLAISKCKKLIKEIRMLIEI